MIESYFFPILRAMAALTFPAKFTSMGVIMVVTEGALQMGAP
ncbi:MAG TPA: hypothetical protein VLA49_04020 [Anaerolineales bacterium]|nr:hypothetical protein [Anaerolineales bacterium]